MATSIQQAVRPLLRITSLSGLSVCSQEKVYLSIIYNLAIWICYTCLYYYTVIAFKVEATFWELNDGTNLFFCILSCVTFVILGTFYSKRFQTFMKRLEAVDDTLAELGTLKMYQQLQTYIKIVIIVWFIHVLVGNVFDMKWWYDAEENHWFMIIPFITNSIYHFNMILDMLLWTFLWYIGTRFEKLNEHMRCLLIKEEHGLRCTWRKSVPINRQYLMGTENYKRIFWILMHLYSELCQISHEFNSIFGVQMTVEMMGFVMTVTQLITHIYIFYTDILVYTLELNRSLTINFIALQYWAVIFMSRLFYANYLCETVSAKARKIEIVHQLTHFLCYADIRNEVYQFMLQVLYHPLKFTGMGLFEFGYSFVRGVFSIIITIVTIRVHVQLVHIKTNGTEEL